MGSVVPEHLYLSADEDIHLLSAIPIRTPSMFCWAGSALGSIMRKSATVTCRSNVMLPGRGSAANLRRTAEKAPHPADFCSTPAAKPLNTCLFRPPPKRSWQNDCMAGRLPTCMPLHTVLFSCLAHATGACRVTRCPVLLIRTQEKQRPGVQGALRGVRRDTDRRLAGSVYFPLPNQRL